MPQVFNLQSLKDLDRITFLTFESAHLTLSEVKSFKVTRLSPEDLSPEALKVRFAARELAYMLDEVFYFSQEAAETLKTRKIEQIEIHSKDGEIKIVSGDEVKIEVASDEYLQNLIDKCCEIAQRTFSQKSTSKSKPLSIGQVLLLHQAQEQKNVRSGVIAYFMRSYSEIVAKIIESFREEREQQKEFQREEDLRQRLLEDRLKYARKQEGIKNDQIEFQQKQQAIASTANKLSSLFSRGKSSK